MKIDPGNIGRQLMIFLRGRGDFVVGVRRRLTWRDKMVVGWKYVRRGKTRAGIEALKRAGKNVLTGRVQVVSRRPK